MHIIMVKGRQIPMFGILNNNYAVLGQSTNIIGVAPAKIVTLRC